MLESGGLFEGIFRTAIDGIIAIDDRGRILSFNPAAERLFGYGAAEATGQNVRVLMPSPDRDRHDSYIASYHATRQGKIIGSGREVTALRKSGERFPIHLAISEAFVGEQRVFVGICRDISELVRVRADLEASRLRSEALLETAADAILTIDAKGSVQSFNGAAERLFSFSRKEVIGRNVKMLMPHAVAFHHDGYLNRALTTGERRVIGIGREVEAQRKDGTRFPAWLSVSQFQVQGIDYFTGILRDISEQKARESEISVLNSELADNAWFSEQQLELNHVTRAHLDEQETLQALLDAVAHQTGALGGTGYLLDEERDDLYVAKAANAAPDGWRERKVTLGEGLLGEAIRQAKIRIAAVPEGQFRFSTSFGDIVPLHLVLVPLLYQDSVIGALELIYKIELIPRKRRHLETLPEVCGVLLGGARDRHRITQLLGQTQSRSSDLRRANEELDQRAHQLLTQQEEVVATNEQLAEQKQRLEAANDELERSRKEVEQKAQALEMTGRYKSEFLANMSHELRTPLNSILVLAKVLAENRSANLTDDQLECLSVIAGSGTDLLNLVNDILDLSKIEAGKLKFSPERIALSSVLSDLERQFLPLMAAKRLTFKVERKGELPATMYTDRLRMEQVLRNLLSNAHKFTEKGSVTMRVTSLGGKGADTGLGSSTPMLKFEVVDTGIGIAPDKQLLVFQAFQQADATLSRRFGGTGLGLSISSSLAQQLGGEIQLASQLGVGSTFTFFIPHEHHFGLEGEKSGERGSTPPPVNFVVPVQTQLAGPVVLLVEDDPATLWALRTLIASRGVRVETATSPGAALDACRRTQFKAVILDLNLGAGSGWDFLQKLHEFGDRVPAVIIHTGRELSDAEEKELRASSRAVIIKGERSSERLLDEVKLLIHGMGTLVPSPVVHRDAQLTAKRVLVVDDDSRNVFALKALLSTTGMKVSTAENGVEALHAFAEGGNFDCVLMDIMMPEMDGYEAIRRLRLLPGGAEIPVIALTAKAMREDRQQCLDAGATDYLSKPINNEQLLGLMRVWMNR